ncbi:MAG: hypothetical protein K0B02_00370 [DPANN group archaeon]|nr:hypothetical protein [DPANN group archaeon]
MDNFVYVFAAGITIFLVAFLLIGQEQLCDSPPCLDYDGGYNDYVPYNPGSDVMSYANTIFIDAKQGQTYRTIDLGELSVGFTQSNHLIKAQDEIIIEHGIFEDNAFSVSFERQGATEAIFEFDVFDTNLYGNLVISFNDEIIFDMKPNLTRYSFYFDNLLEMNTLSIEAEGSSMKFWAPTAYILKDFYLSINSYSYTQKVIPFNVEAYEFNSLDNVEFSFQVLNARRNDNLTAYVNGYLVYTGDPMPRAKVYKANFGKFETLLLPGENHILFTSGQDSEYTISDAQLKISYYGAISPSIHEVKFKLTENQYDRIDNGTAVLSFDIPVVSIAGLKIYMNDKFIDETVYEGTNKFYLHTDILEDGDNLLRFQTLGTYKIDNLEISILDEVI